MAIEAISASAQETVARFDMSLTDDGKITETVSNQQYAVQSQLKPFTVEGLSGEALRFDGYSNYVKAAIDASKLSDETLTLQVTLAVETYPMMQVDVAETEPTYATICGNIDEDAKKGIALQLSSQGDLKLRFGSASGFILEVKGEKKLPRGEWYHIIATLDKANNEAAIYIDSEKIGSGRMSRQGIAHSTADFYIGKDATEQREFGCLINTFCGLIDDINISNEIFPFDRVDFVPHDQLPLPDFRYPAERYADNLCRPQFHGMPSGGWTNESHGMIYADGRYHVFFQKNANGPYMSRLHWGHISSENLYQWQEEPIAVYPGEDYDLKGCWSGCVYDDDGTPTLLYTAVDNAKARIAKATAADEAVATWQKQGIIIDGRPAGLSDDFRDPYWFTANGEQYIIVGTSKNNVGACTLHKLTDGTWSNTGDIFFQGTSANQHGTFWEMPTITPMGDGRWLFTCTPLGTGVGVRTLCWVGTIGQDGKFTSDGQGPQYLEMGGISRDGYGLLSPTIYQHNGKTLLLGIVPDKLPTEENVRMGWAHNYSLPREITLGSDGQLIQQPYSGLTGMRSETAYEKTLDLLGQESLSPVSGRQIELLGEFTVGSGAMGFNFLKQGSHQASLTYDADLGTLTLDLTALDRTPNDNGSYKGIYSASLPEKVAVGGQLKLHVYLDGSIADIFVNDRWAYSVRLFPTDASQIEAEAFATAQTPATLKAWTLNASQSAPTAIHQIENPRSADSKYFDLLGRRLSSAPQKGIYISDGKKCYAR